MKLRIRGNSIRLRVTQTELETIQKDGEVRDTVRFTEDSALTYRLQSSADIGAPVASFDPDGIVVGLPLATVANWAATDAVSIASEQEIQPGQSLSILVEKDFACLQPRPGEDESDMFAHPEEGRSEC